MVHPKDRDPGAPRGPAAEPTLVPPAGSSPVGSRVLGGRYEIRGVLGRGGMGEVWLARDLKLQVEVALKALTPEKLGDEAALTRLRAEVRSARAVASPHVCRVYDLVEAEGLECVSMEYVDGTTLRHVLETRSPLSLEEAREIALQLLAGLGAIHEAGLVHRDVKPENVMLTRAGRVVLMDFGIAKAVASGGTVAGTPAYWPPEQAMGAPADPRADVFAAGIVLAEMVAPAGVRDHDQRQALWQGLREDPPRIPDTPWSEAIARAVARDPGRRYPSAQALARALEEVAHRVTGVEEAQPYPGLAAFTEADAEYFFGREAEVEEVWKRLPHRHLLALVGPSGAGKSSFLRAGLIPAKPGGWAYLICTPGDAPFVALGQALVPEVSRDTDAMRQMLRFEDADVAVGLFRRWRSDHGEALVIVDQFEELFTLNPPDVQDRFSSLLSRLVLEADVHVLLSIRDDFLLRCQEHEALRPVFSDLMPLGPPTGDALRRALVQPALKCGYKFEDESLVGEMLQVVEGERGALPLLAFAAASLWDRRDRTQGLLTRAAHEAIGGVAGALAQHAEATLERIGAEHQSIVREIFRNLVTAEGTRAVRDVDELISVFPEDQRSSAEPVLKELIDARLLTSYEAHAVEPGQRAGRRVEVVHESLLSAWPRLVRWRTEDEGSAQLRDQLRQAAHLWEEKGRPDDLLWTGTSYQEYQVWRSRYPGGLSETEETFARAMVVRARRKRRLVRAVAAAVVLISIGVAIAIGVSRHQAVLARDRAEAEAQRAEAGKLLALGQRYLDADPTAALAYVRASLELFDTPEARRFAVEVLWRAPVARILPVQRMAREQGLPEDGSSIADIELSPDGRWLATRNSNNRQILLFPRDGGPPRALPRQPDGNTRVLEFGRQGDLLLTGGSGESVRFWSWPELRELRSVELGGLRSYGFVRDGKLFTFTRVSDDPARPWMKRIWPLAGGEPQVVVDRTPLFPDIDASGTTLAYWRGRSVLVRPLSPADASRERVLGQSRDDVQSVAFSPTGDRVAALDRTGEIRIWPTAGGVADPLRILRGPKYQAGAFTLFDAQGRLLTQRGLNNAVLLWDLDGPPDPEPAVVGRPGPGIDILGAFDPGGHWLATSNAVDSVELWPLRTLRVRVIRGVSSTIWSMAFTSDGRWLATCGITQPARLWPLAAVSGVAHELAPPEPCIALAAHPTRGELLVGSTDSEVLLYPVSGGPPRRLGGWGGAAMATPVGFDPTGRLALAGPYSAGRGLRDPKDRVLRVWDLESGQERVYSVASLTDADWDGSFWTGFGADGRLYGNLAKGGDIVRLTLPMEPGGEIASETVVAAGSSHSFLSPDGRLLLVLASETKGIQNMRFERLLLFDLVRHTSRSITTHGDRLFTAAFDRSGSLIVTGDTEGVVRVGPTSGGEPHLLLGHEGMITSLAVSPDGRWIASATEESVRLWPMPDLSKPPLHTLPHADFLAKLDTLTNLRAVRDPSSSTGWKLEVGPFPGWATVPEWNP
jgi:WD40 repeat protein